MRPWWKIALLADAGTMSKLGRDRFGSGERGLAADNAWIASARGSDSSSDRIVLSPVEIESHHGYSLGVVGEPTPKVMREAVRLVMPRTLEECQKIVRDLIPAHRTEDATNLLTNLSEDLTVPERVTLVSEDIDDGRTMGYLVYDRMMKIGDQNIHLENAIHVLALRDTLNHLPALLAAYHAQRVVDIEAAVSSCLEAGDLPPIYIETSVNEHVSIDHQAFVDLGHRAWEEAFDPKLGDVPPNYMHLCVNHAGMPEMLSGRRHR